MKKDERKKELIGVLWKQYGTLLLTRRQTAQALNISTSKLDRLKASGRGPEYKKDEPETMSVVGKNSAVYYPIDGVVEYMLSKNKKTV